MSTAITSRLSPNLLATVQQGFLGLLPRVERHAAIVFRGLPASEREELHPCPSCGAPTTAEVCAFCKLVNRAGSQAPSGLPARTPGS